MSRRNFAEIYDDIEAAPPGLPKLRLLAIAIMTAQEMLALHGAEMPPEVREAFERQIVYFEEDMGPQFESLTDAERLMLWQLGDEPPSPAKEQLAGLLFMPATGSAH